MPEQAKKEEQKNILLARLKKQRLILQGKGNTVFEGDFLEIYENFIILGNVVISGSQHVVRPPWVLVDKSTISHIHPLVKVDKLEEEAE